MEEKRPKSNTEPLHIRPKIVPNHEEDNSNWDPELRLTRTNPNFRVLDKAIYYP